MDLLCHLLVAMEMTPPTESGLYVDCCVSSLVGHMSEDRLALVRSVSCMTSLHPCHDSAVISLLAISSS